MNIINNFTFANRSYQSRPSINKQENVLRFKNELLSDTVSFGSSNKCVVGENGIWENCNYTKLFREDVDWKELAKYLDEKYKNHDHPQITCFACSDGSEVYTLILSLIDELGEDRAQKFFPISAVDISGEIIEIANSGEIYLSSADIKKLDSELKNIDINEYLEGVGEKGDKKDSKYKVLEKLADKVNFRQGDILKEKIDSDVVMFRNAWTFNSIYDQKMLSRKLKNELKEGQIVMIGNGDLQLSNAKEYLTDEGFNEIDNKVNRNIPFSPEYINMNTIGNPRMQKFFNKRGLIYEK